ncbi:hypothetical protein [uncultured Tolumonas sp.]|uniref:hypothetical protein n=1 Tax=uncultured Tolumonas sp. TaxID=263765 RepID=UPI002A0A2FEE|nr:hypothetical protein [uncultured Tolumonas sp.]
MKKLIRFFKIIGIIFVSVIALVVWGSKHPSSAPNNKQTEEVAPARTKEQIDAEVKENVRKSMSIELEVKSERAVRNSLKDPDSAKFKGFYMSKKNAGCGLVNAKNSFGGYVGFKRFISDGKTSIVEDTDSSFQEVWEKLCASQ